MPDIGGTVRTIMLADGTVSGLVGTRVYSDVLTQNATTPAITYKVVDTVTNDVLAGIADVSRARIQVDCYGVTRPAANTLADAVRLALHGHEHTATGGQYVLDITLPSGEVYLVNEPEDGTDKRRFINSQDFMVSYRTTTS